MASLHIQAMLEIWQHRAVMGLWGFELAAFLSQVWNHLKHNKIREVASRQAEMRMSDDSVFGQCSLPETVCRGKPAC